MRYLVSFLLILIAGCQTNPPDAFELNIPSAKVFINSDVSGAEIFADNVTSGKFTPDTLLLAYGQHKISLHKEGYAVKDTVINIQIPDFISLHFHLEQASVQKLVLIEDFANVSCNPCVISNNIIHSLNNYTFKNKIAVIKYATYWPGPNDPFYLAAKTECDSRIGYYNIIVAPTIWVDGLTKPVPSDSNKIKSAIDAQLAKTSRFGIEVSQNIIGEQLQANVKVSFIDTSGLNFNDLVLHTVLVESEIEFSTAPGSNGETKFYHVMRSMSPSPDGESLKNQAYEYQRGINCNPVWNKSKIKVVAFIQNKATKEIYQTGITN